MGWFNEMQRLSASPENAVKLQRALAADRRPRPAAEGADADPDLPLARRPGGAVRGQGEELAADIPGAAFVPLESENHILLENEPAWRDVRARSAREFLARRTADPGGPRHRSSPSRRTKSGPCTGPRRREDRLCVSGEGFPLVKAPNWMTHLEHDRTSPVLPATGSRNCSGANRLVRSDMRGFGLSELEPADIRLSSRWSGPWRRDR